jgi:hypothetical protein
MMRFGKRIQVAAGLVSLTVLAGVTAGCANKAPADDAMAARVEAAANKAEMAATRADAAAKSAADAAAKAQAAADKAEAIFHKHMKK